MKIKDLKIVSDFTVKGMTEDDEDIIIEGYANTTTKDRMGDVILEEAWTKGGLDNYLKNPVILAYHDHKKPIGAMVEYGVNNNGLHITAKISKVANDVYDLVKSGVLKAFSVGFRLKDADYDTTTDIFVIKDLELHEISVVSVPANADSLFSVQKSFDNEEEFIEFKKSFIEVGNKEEPTNKGEINVDDDKNVIKLTPEELEAKKKEAIDEAKAAEKAIADAEAKVKETAVSAGSEAAERLVADLEKKLEDNNSRIDEVIKGFESQLKEKTEELEAIQRSKMSFEDKGNKSIITEDEIDTAVLVAILSNKGVKETDYFKTLIEKAGDHLGGTNADNYETIFSTRMYDEIQDRLILEPLFSNKISMNSRTMVFPFNPEAGYASWVADGDYKSHIDPASETNQADGTYTDYNSSSAVPRNHPITDFTLKAEKLASKEQIGYEEEEDSIIPIVPIVRGAIARRMSRTSDLALLRGDIGVATVTDTGPSLINGVAVLADDQNTEVTQGGTFGTANPVTVADLQSIRRTMGRYGHMPGDVVYIVNQSVYFDLLEDPDFRTMDLVGNNATILRGQVGMINGSSVIVSDSFATPATGQYAAVALNTTNYMLGELRGVRTERTRDVLNQKDWIVTTRRFAFRDIDSNATSCAVLKYPAS
jgi:HK97 family phage prohead protease